MAVPASSPPYHAATSAAACSAAKFAAMALPLVRTTITGLPVAMTAFTRFSCGSGRSRLVRSPPMKPGMFTRRISSPSSSELRPTKTIATSDSFASVTASARAAAAGGIQPS